MPSQNSVGSDDASKLAEKPPAWHFAFHRQPSPLTVGETKPLILELVLQNSVLFLEILNDCLLMVVDPASQGEQEKVQRRGGDRHEPGLYADALHLAFADSIRSLDRLVLQSYSGIQQPS